MFMSEPKKLQVFSLNPGQTPEYVLGSHLGKILGFERGVLYTKHPNLQLKQLTSSEKEHALRQGVATYRFPRVMVLHVNEVRDLLVQKYPGVNIEITTDVVPLPPSYRATKPEYSQKSSFSYSFFFFSLFFFSFLFFFFSFFLFLFFPYFCYFSIFLFPLFNS